MPCSPRNISEMLLVIHSMEKFDFLKSVIHSLFIFFSVFRSRSGLSDIIKNNENMIADTQKEITSQVD